MVKKTDCNTKITEIENKILNVTTSLVTTAAENTKATEIENKIPDITNVAAKAVLYTKATKVESKIPDSINLATIKAALNRRALKIENKIPGSTGCFTTSEFDKLTKILSVFIPNAGKYRPGKLQIRTLSTQCYT